MGDRVAAVCWSIEDVASAAAALATASRLVGAAEAVADPHGRRDESVPIGPWIEAVCERLGVEAEQVEIVQAEVGALLRSAAPALLRVPLFSGGHGILALLGGGRNHVRVLGPDLRAAMLPVAAVEEQLRRPLRDELARDVMAGLDRLHLDVEGAEHVRDAIVADHCRRRRFDDCWLLRLPPGAGFLPQLGLAGVPARLLELVGLQALYSAGFIFSWWMVARGALQGRVDMTWLGAWALLLLALVPLRCRTTWLQGWLAITCGALLKQRLLAGALRMDPDEVRRKGCGQMLGTVMESDAVESLALGGGIACIPSLVELTCALAILALAGSGALQLPLLAAWLGLAVVLAWRYVRARSTWADVRLALTHDLIEGMVGHRTRLAQEPADRWHIGEDAGLERYIRVCTAMDRTAGIMAAVVPRGWLLVGIASLAPFFLSPSTPRATVAVSLGAVILGWRALTVITAGILNVADAVIAWRRVGPLFHAAGRPRQKGTLDAVVRRGGGNGLLMEARDLTFRHATRSEPVIRQCSLRIARGARVLLEGASGSGKSTLASLLVGIRDPQSGLLLLDGWDRQTLGADNWRRRVVLAPQFHENHVFSETFAFNLLMGRSWPPTAADRAEAEDVCRLLGLAPLLERMPAGLMQMVGECGWQLSHGERSRLYIARALLQDADLVVLDESFAALDPENLRQALGAVFERARSLVVIAHP